MNSHRGLHFVTSISFPLLAVFSLVALASLPIEQAEARTPNVVLIIGDDQAWGDFAFMGHSVIETPCLDRLASQSLVFTRGYVPSSLCRASLASIVTGLYAHEHRITSNDPSKALPREEFLRQRQQQIDNIDRVPTLPRLLGQGPGAHLSLQTGKWWEGHHGRGGFTHGMTHGDPQRGGRHGDEGLKIGRAGLEPVFDFIDASGDRPFFIWYAPFLPHTPHNPPERLLKKYIDKTDSPFVARYWAMCEWFDETCGGLLDFLDRRNLADDTLVLFVTDNGWIQKPMARGYDERSKRSPNEGGVRTPIMVRWPGKIEPKRDDVTPVLSIDLAPTVLAACGLEPTPGMQGVNLLDAQAPAERKAVFGEIFAHNAVDITRPASCLEYRWCIEGCWKLIVPNTANLPDATVELYNLQADPHENENLADGNADRVEHLRALIDAWWPGT